MKWHFVSIGLTEFNINSVNERPIGGVESSLCFLMNSLNQINEEIHFWNQSGNEGIIKNISHYKLSNLERLSEIGEDIVIYIGNTKHLPSLRKNINQKIPILLWTQHSHDQPSALPLKEKEIIKNLDGIVFVSEWQKINHINYFDIDETPSYCIGNGITPSFCNMFTSIDNFKENKLKNFGIYSSTPFRGLEKLYQSSRYIKEDIIIDIYSSMKVYKQDQEDKKYSQLYEKISNSKKFKYFSSVNKKELAKAHINKSFLTYPSFFAETFCITLLDSLAAGLEPIITDLGALKETSNGFGKLLPINNNFLQEYARSLDESINNKKLNFEKWCEKQYKQCLFINENYTWEKKAEQWLDLIKTIIFKKKFIK